MLQTTDEASRVHVYTHLADFWAEMWMSSWPPWVVLKPGMTEFLWKKPSIEPNLPDSIPNNWWGQQSACLHTFSRFLSWNMNVKLVAVTHAGGTHFHTFGRVLQTYTHWEKIHLLWAFSGDFAGFYNISTKHIVIFSLVWIIFSVN